MPPVPLHAWRPGDPLRAAWLDEFRRYGVRAVSAAGGIVGHAAQGVATIGGPEALARGFAAVWATVKSSSLDGVNRWAYTIELPWGELVEAENVCEELNTATFAGPGLDPSLLPAGFAVTAIGKTAAGVHHDIRVPAWRDVDGGGWVFWAPNAVDGECPEGGLAGGGELWANVDEAQTSIPTGWQDVTALTVDLETGKSYTIEAQIVHTSSAATIGVSFGLNGPACARCLTIQDTWSSATLPRTVGSVGYDNVLTFNGNGPASAERLACLRGLVYATSAAGALVVRSFAEAGGTADVLPGSWLRVREYG